MQHPVNLINARVFPPTFILIKEVIKQFWEDGWHDQIFFSQILLHCGVENKLERGPVLRVWVFQKLHMSADQCQGGDTTVEVSWREFVEWTDVKTLKR